MPDPEACPSDDASDFPNATDEEASPNQYKKTRRDDDDDEKANESEGSSDECINPEAIDRDAALTID